MRYDLLSRSDSAVYNSILGEIKRQNEGIELIASENYVSSAVLDAMGSILTNKYSEGFPNKRYYGGNKYIDEIELLAIERAKEIFKAQHVNVQPYSGSPANFAVYLAFLSPKDRVLGMDLFAGGHLTHGFKVSATGKWFDSMSYGVNREGYIDYDEVMKTAKEFKPKLIWAGYSAYSRVIDWSEFRKIADSVGAILAVDIAHIAGLIAGGVLDSPISFADIVTTTTHKTLRGPRGAMIMCKSEYAEIIDKAVFPGLQGGPHNHTTAGIAVALKEAQSREFKQYAKDVVDNAQKLSMSLIHIGYTIVSGGTDNHLLLLNLTNHNVTGKEAEVALEKAGITVNKNTVPFETRKPWDPSGIRIGTPAITTRGLKVEHMETVAEFIDRAIKSSKDDEALKKIAGEVKEFISPYKIPGLE